MSSPTFEPSQSPNYSFVAPPDPSPNMQTLLDYIDAVNAWDVDRMLEVFDDTLEHRILPKSLNRPVLNKNQYSAYIRGVHGMIKDFRVTVHEVIENDNIIIIHASTRGQGRQSGVPYANEVMQVMHFIPSEDGFPKMRFVKEFVDSAKVTEFFRKEREAQAAQAAGRA